MENKQKSNEFIQKKKNNIKNDIYKSNLNFRI